MIREDLEYKCFPPYCNQQQDSLAFRQPCLVEFRQSLTQERADCLLFQTRIEEGGEGVEREEQDGPHHTEPAGQEGGGELFSLLRRNLLPALDLKLASEAVR